MELGNRLGLVLRAVDLDVVVINLVAGVEPNDGATLYELLVQQLLEHGLRVVEELLGLSTNGLVFEDLGVSSVGVLASDLPSLEEGVPVDKWQQLS